MRVDDEEKVEETSGPLNFLKYRATIYINAVLVLLPPPPGCFRLKFDRKPQIMSQAIGNVRYFII